MSDDDKKATANPAGESNAEVLRLDLSAHNKTMDFLRTTERRPIGLPVKTGISAEIPDLFTEAIYDLTPCTTDGSHL